MKALRNISIYRKLIFIQMVTALAVVLLITGTFVYVNFHDMRTTRVEGLNSLTSVLATNSASTLVFNDDETAKSILNDLKQKKDILAAEIIDGKGQTFAYFSREKNFAPLRFVGQHQAQAHLFDENILFVSKEIRFDGERIGFVVLKAQTNDLNTFFLKRINIAGIVAIIGIVLAFVLASTLQKYISRPIYGLLNVMNEVKNTSNYKIRVKPESQDEIGNLSRVFNQMLNEIEKKDEMLLHSNTTLQEKVQERTKELEENNRELIEKNAEIVEAKEQAERSRAVKESFLANMSHEIRTPLNAILGFQQLLKETELSDDQMEYVNAIDFAGNNLLTLVNDILDLSKIESGKLRFEESNFSLKRQVEQVMELLQKRARDKGLRLHVSGDDRIPDHVIGDSTRFNQILLNLVGNAIKFTEKGSVNVIYRLQSMDGEFVKCKFEVHDTGIGIAPDKISKIFDRFTQGGNETTRLYGGTGLGLTIAKILVEEFGGKLDVQSEQGKGSVFQFTIAFKKSQGDEHVVSPEREEKTGNSRKKLKILLAEDVVINQRLMSRMAQSWGYDLDIAPNGKQAISRLIQSDYDIVLMDIQMPEMNGFEATKVIREFEDEDKRQVPIIALTAHASNAEADRCIEAGMNAYVSKPFDQKHLLSLIRKLVRSDARTETPWGDVGMVHEKKRVVRHGLLDLKMIFDRAEGDQAYIDEMLDTYLESMSEYAQQIHEQIALKDAHQTYELVHKMKSPLALFGVRRALDLIQRLEEGHQQEMYTDNWFFQADVLRRLVERSILDLKNFRSRYQQET
ncbi:MAG: response regulator [Bacteroidetes bacterium]|nr:MAG: response regulator [Bacteroidota bacterium]